MRPGTPVDSPSPAERAAWLAACAVPIVAVAWTTYDASGRWDALWVSSTQVSTQLLAVLLPLFFLLIIIRLVLAMRRSPGQRLGFGTLGTGIALWAAGAVALNAQGPPSSVTFPSAGEGFFLAAYTGMAANLFLSRPSTERLSLSAWLDAAVTFGGGICLVGVLLASPVSDDVAGSGVPLLVALLYPILDLALIMVVVGQLIAGVRPLSRRTVLLLVGFAALLAADASIMFNLAHRTYTHGPLLDLTWACGFLLLTAAVCADVEAGDGRRPLGGGKVTAAAAVVAVTVLAAAPPGELRSLLTIPAVGTLGAAVARLLVAVRQAREAAEAYRLSLTDDLTGLPNRRALLKRLTADLDDGADVGLLLLDLDGFKEINDSLGHSAGDAVLQIIATRVAHAAPSPAFAARLGGDEFAVVYPHADTLTLLESAHTIRAVLRKECSVDGMDLTVDCSIGVAVKDGSATCYQDLLRRADVAMYQAKAARAGPLLYDGARDEFSRQRLQLAEELRLGIARGQIRVWYQPQLEATSRRVVSVEALVRWDHPDRGLLAPGTFLPTARRSGLLPALTDAVVAIATRDLGRLHAAGSPVRLSLNVAPAELLAEHFTAKLLNRVRSAGLPSGALIVEVTEDSFLAEPERARQVILGLRREGIQVSIDDYGTGFSSLSYLRDLPVSELKIDRTFVKGILTDRRSRTIVETTITLAHALGLRVVAEGVETSAVASALQQIEVDVLQGFHFARPLPFDELEAWLTAHEESRPVAPAAPG